MSEHPNSPTDPGLSAAYLRGRRAGLAAGALAAAVVAFVNLLGLEKALLAATLAFLALQRMPAGAPGRKLAVAAACAAGAYAVTWLVILAVFHEKLFELFQLLQKLG